MYTMQNCYIIKTIIPNDVQDYSHITAIIYQDLVELDFERFSSGFCALSDFKGDIFV